MLPVALGADLRAAFIGDDPAERRFSLVDLPVLTLVVATRVGAIRLDLAPWWKAVAIAIIGG